MITKTVSSKTDKNKLYEDWKNEMEIRGKQAKRFLTTKVRLKLFWWKVWCTESNTIRLVFFMSRCCEGMAHEVAWHYTHVWKMNDIELTLLNSGWDPFN